MDVEVLKNQLVIMRGILASFWNNTTGEYAADREYIEELKTRISFTRARIGLLTNGNL